MEEFRESGAHSQTRSLGWLYLLAVIPVLTEVVETGGLPHSPRGWLTELAAGIIIAALVRKVLKEHHAAQTLARSDSLTGLANRHAFFEYIGAECARARRYRHSLSLAYIDLDQFKQVNDSAGHDAGDRVLRQLAAAIDHEVRARVDRGFRIGGDEFALVLPDSTAEQARRVIQRIRRHCAAADPVWIAGTLGISAGIVELQRGESAGDFVRRADEAMYREKRARGADLRSRRPSPQDVHPFSTVTLPHLRTGNPRRAR